MSSPATPEFDHPDFLQQHIRSILAFYEPRVIAAEPGLRSCFLDNGDCFDPHSRQLVGSARYVVNYATAFRLYGTPHYRD